MIFHRVAVAVNSERLRIVFIAAGLNVLLIEITDLPSILFIISIFHKNIPWIFFATDN